MTGSKSPKCPIMPFNDRVVVVGDKPAEKVGLLYVPDKAKEEPQRGVVVAVGPGKYADRATKYEKVGEYAIDQPVRTPMTAKVGDTVWFGKYSGSVIEIQGVEYRVMREDELYGTEG